MIDHHSHTNFVKLSCETDIDLVRLMVDDVELTNVACEKVQTLTMGSTKIALLLLLLLLLILLILLLL